MKTAGLTVTDARITQIWESVLKRNFSATILIAELNSRTDVIAAVSVASIKT